MLCKLALLLSSCEEASNLADPLDQTILSHWDICIATTQSAALQHSKLRNND